MCQVCVCVCNMLDAESEANSLVYTASLLTIQACVLYITNQGVACVK